jgi:hypothetical protein
LLKLGGIHVIEDVRFLQGGVTAFHDNLLYVGYQRRMIPGGYWIQTMFLGQMALGSYPSVQKIEFDIVDPVR